MLNEKWRKIGIVLGIIIVGLIGVFIGTIIEIVDTAKWFIEMAVDMGIVDGVGKAELMEYFIKLKGGGC